MRTRRLLAKLVDFLAMAGFTSLGLRWFSEPLGASGAAWAGLALGGAYLLLGDALGTSAKNWFGLAVVDVNTGKRCSLASSVLRNTPWLAAPLFRTALLQFSGAASASAGATTAAGALGVSTGSLAVDVARGIIGLVGLVVAVTLWRGLGKDGKGRHWADRWADTRVISTRPGESDAPPARARSSRSGASAQVPSSRSPAARGPRAPVEDRDAPDFDDADERPSRAEPEGKPRRARTDNAPARTERDAADFDDAAN